jgi:hypothetical protein
MYCDWITLETCKYKNIRCKECLENNNDENTQYIDKRIDADIYLDVDGVLFTMHNNIFELRDGFLGFLKFLVTNFRNCYWLTCWEDSFNDVLRKTYAGRIADEFKWAKWNHGRIEGKATGIQDWNRPFVWIEDGIGEWEMKVLKEHGCDGNFIYVPYKGEMDYLYKVKEELIRRFNIVLTK